MEQGNGGEKRLPEPVTGTEPGPGPSAAKGESHHEFFNRALDNALEEIERRWPDPAQYEVTVTLEARVEVENPGGIGEYRVRMT